MTSRYEAAHENFENSLVAFQNDETVNNFRVLLHEVLRRGYAIDFEIKGGNTLLHHAVSLNLDDDVVLILRAGAQILKNNYGKSPIDLALERGNQCILFFLRRSSDYYNYLIAKNPSKQILRAQSSVVDDGAAAIFGVSKYAWSPKQIKQRETLFFEPSLQLTDVIHEDYVDWTDQQAVEKLQVFTNLYDEFSPHPHCVGI
jgi:hypothetical protein